MLDSGDIRVNDVFIYNGNHRESYRIIAIDREANMLTYEDTDRPEDYPHVNHSISDWVRMVNQGYNWKHKKFDDKWDKRVKRMADA